MTARLLGMGLGRMHFLGGTISGLFRDGWVDEGIEVAMQGAAQILWHREGFDSDSAAQPFFVYLIIRVF